MQTIYGSITETIGRTPLVRLRRISEGCRAQVLVKLESFNPMSSVKDRIAVSMIEDAESSGGIGPETILVEPTSGNTGVGLAFACAAKGIRLMLVMPDSMSVERRRLMKILGAELVLTPGSEGMKGAIAEAERLLEEIPGSLMLQQFSNPANPEAHRRTTAVELLEDTDRSIDFFVAGVGTGGTITGVGEVLKANCKGVRIVAVEPEDSPVLSGGQPGPHKNSGYRGRVCAAGAEHGDYRRSCEGEGRRCGRCRSGTGPEGGDSCGNIVRCRTEGGARYCPKGGDGREDGCGTPSRQR